MLIVNLQGRVRPDTYLSRKLRSCDGFSLLLYTVQSIHLTILTYSWSWALLQKSPIVQLLKNFPAFYGTRRFITVFTRAFHWSLSWARSIQFIPSYLSKIHFNIIHPPTPWSSQWSLSFWLPHQYPVRIPILSTAKVKMVRPPPPTQTSSLCRALLKRKDNFTWFTAWTTEG
jgi:hypothetical protein